MSSVFTKTPAATATAGGAVEVAQHIKQRLGTDRGYRDLLQRVAGGDLPLAVAGPKPGFYSFMLQHFQAAAPGPLLVVTPTEQEAELLVGDLELLAGEHVRRFPWWGTLPYAAASPLPSVFGERASLLTELTLGKGLDEAIIVTSLRALVTPVPPVEYLRERVLRLAVGADIDPVATEQTLVSLGFVRVPRVSVRGEFSVKGEVIDVFPYGRDHALRAVLEFDTIEQLREFEPGTQRSVGSLDAVTVFPVREVYLAGATVDTLRTNMEATRLPPDGREQFLQAIERDPDARGVEFFYPMCFASTAALTELLPESALLVLLGDERLSSGYAALRKEYNALYRRAATDGHFGPMPKSFVLDYGSLMVGHERRIELHELASAARRSGARAAQEEAAARLDAAQAADHDQDGRDGGDGDGAGGAGGRGNGADSAGNRASVDGNGQATARLKLACDPPRSFFGNIPYFRDELNNLVDGGYRVFIFAVYDHQAERLQAMLGELAKRREVQIYPESISAGFALPEAKLVVIQENEIFGRKRRIPRESAKVESEAIDSFVELTEGDYVVHVNYGIGLYHGLQRMSSMGNERDYIELEFGGEERVYLPIEQVNLIQRYVGKDGRVPKLDRIGGKAWESRKAKVRRAVEELAERLVRLYSTRKQVQGTAFGTDTDWQAQFEAGFPYQETEDQIRCIEEVKADMESPAPMDRLVCGDVGFGKTEVALRAAFKAVMGGRQVAVLAPTTILAEQHFETFTERFAPFPVRVEMLSRFRSKRAQRAVVAAVGEGAVDVIIGTHRLVQKDVKFKNLGLLVTDEEQRFGVKHKERLKELKANVDSLTLTATPIPRTLHMSLTKIRDMSLITTPPQNRLPIETFIQEFDEALVADAVRRELARGGQVFYLHNRVRSIQETQGFLTRLLPEASIDIAHGQMDEIELEDVMHRFVGGEFEVLLATSIIENGLDIPNVNTIIIDRADMFGIGQLYQLRGRVGRSEVPAYAYLFYPKDRALSELAMKRLRIISDFTELGSGFKVAMKDLEVRGAGNLLGREQSGDILAVGYDMYVRLLDQAIAALGGKEKALELDVPDVYLELEYTGYIPDDYISEPVVKMEVYKKISAVTSAEELERIHAELEDRFGPLPDAVLSLLSIAEIRIVCRRLFVSSLRESRGVVTVEFARMQKVSVDKVMRLLQESGGTIHLDPERPNCLRIDTGGIGLREKSEFLSEKLGALL